MASGAGGPPKVTETIDDFLRKHRLKTLHAKLVASNVELDPTYRGAVSRWLQPGDSDSGVTNGEVCKRGLVALFTPDGEPQTKRVAKLNREQLEELFDVRGGKAGTAPHVTALQEGSRGQRETLAPKPAKRARTEPVAILAPRIVQGGLGVGKSAVWDSEEDEATKLKREARRVADQSIHVPLDDLGLLTTQALGPTLGLFRELEWAGYGNPFTVKYTRSNVKDYGIPGYFSVIKTPMDLTRMQEKLNSLKYTSPDQFFKDAELIVENAKSFNLKGDPFYTMAEQLFELIKSSMPDGKERFDMGLQRIKAKIRKKQARLQASLGARR